MIRFLFEIIIQEGTAKYADVATAINVTLGKKNRHKMTRDQPQPVGVIINVDFN